MRYIKTILILVTLFILGVFLYERGAMSLAQHFDLDEYAYLHWAAHMAIGKVPFRDFFFYMTPGFVWVLTPIFWIFPNDLTPIFVARFVEYGAFILLAFSTAWLFWDRKRSWLALLVPLILFFLPLPNIKFTEIRPDTLGMAFVVLAILFVKKNRFIAGLLYGLSLLVIPKTLPAVIVGFLFMLPNILEPIAGFTLVLAGGLFWLFSVGGTYLIKTALYSTVGIPLETSAKLGGLFPISLGFFFKPNAFFYGVGSDIARITNHIMWGIGAIIAVWRLVIRKNLLIPVTFVSQIIFLVLVSTHHAQYFIPLAVWVSYFVADGINEIYKHSKPLLFALFYIPGIVYLLYISYFVVTTRWVLPMNSTFSVVTDMWKTIPKNEYVFDLEGITLYYPDPYYVCCLPFGQTQQYLSRPFPNLIASLEETHTKYIYQGGSLRINTLSLADQAYITEHYQPWNGHKELLVRK